MEQFLERFPIDKALLSRLLAENENVRNLCEDLALAKSTLGALEKFQKEQEVSRIVEYRELVADLEKEITSALEHAKQSK